MVPEGQRETERKEAEEEGERREGEVKRRGDFIAIGRSTRGQG